MVAPPPFQKKNLQKNPSAAVRIFFRSTDQVPGKRGEREYRLGRITNHNFD